VADLEDEVEKRSYETLKRLPADKSLAAMLFQVIDYLELEFKACSKCRGSGDGDTWIPICMTCHGLGRKMEKKDGN
jgi:hypothetical protein